MSLLNPKTLMNPSPTMIHHHLPTVKDPKERKREEVANAMTRFHLFSDEESRRRRRKIIS